MLMSRRGQFAQKSIWWPMGGHWRLLSLALVSIACSANAVENSADPLSIGSPPASPSAQGSHAVAVDMHQRLMLDTIFSAHAPLLKVPMAAMTVPVKPSASPAEIKRIAV